MKTRRVGRIDMQTGGYILDAEYVDYNDGAGEQLWAGKVYNEKHEYIGHVDPPGPKGKEGKMSSNLVIDPT